MRASPMPRCVASGNHPPGRRGDRLSTFFMHHLDPDSFDTIATLATQYRGLWLRSGVAERPLGNLSTAGRPKALTVYRGSDLRCLLSTDGPGGWCDPGHVPERVLR